jgi:hypothetical protein
MDSHEHSALPCAVELFVLPYLADDKREVFLVVEAIVKQTERKFAGIGGNSGARLSVNGDCGGHSESLHNGSYYGG